MNKLSKLHSALFRSNNRLICSISWFFWRLRSTIQYFLTGNCGNECKYASLYGFVPEAECSIHDRPSSRPRLFLGKYGLGFRIGRWSLELFLYERKPVLGRCEGEYFLIRHVVLGR